jgi:hypothetical protein
MLCRPTANEMGGLCSMSGDNTCIKYVNLVKNLNVEFQLLNVITDGSITVP